MENGIAFWEAVALRAQLDLEALREEISRDAAFLAWHCALIACGELTPPQSAALRLGKVAR